MSLREKLEREYEPITNIALLVGFISTISMEYWPQFAGLAVTVMVLATITAMSVYFSVRPRLPGAPHSVNEAPQDEANKSITNAVSRPEVPGVTASQPSKAPSGSDEPIKQRPNQRPEWGDITNAINQLFSSHVGQSRVLEFRTTNPSAETKIPEIRRTDSQNLYKNLYLLSLLDVINEQDFQFRPRPSGQLIRNATTLSRALDIGIGTKSTTPVVVKIGPVTIELKDDETRVHIESAKPVVTSIAGSEQGTRADQIGVTADDDLGTGKPKVIH